MVHGYRAILERREKQGDNLKTFTNRKLRLALSDARGVVSRLHTVRTVSVHR